MSGSRPSTVRSVPCGLLVSATGHATMPGTHQALRARHGNLRAACGDLHACRSARAHRQSVKIAEKAPGPLASSRS